MTTGPSSAAWGAGRWVVTVLAFAAVLGGSAGLLTRWPQLPPIVATPHPEFLLNLATAVGGSPDDVLPNPTGFALGDPHGFSGAAAAHLPRNAYTLAEFKAAPTWLRLDHDGQRLGRPVPLAAVQARSDRLPVPSLPLSLQPAPLVPATNRVAVDAAFARRPLLRLGAVPPPVDEVLPATVVEVGVNPWGQVVSARVVAASGSAAADRSALEASRGALFAPLPNRLKSADAVLTELQWGRLVFTWGSGVPLR